MEEKKQPEAQEISEEVLAEQTENVEQTAESENTEQAAENVQTESSEQKLLAEAQALAEDYKRKWYAVTAEYENFRRRTANQSAQRYAEGRADVVSKLFPIGDNLERAIASCSDEQTKKGIELVTKAFVKILSEEKITEVNPLGEAFDAEKCEAIMAVDPKEGEESGIVQKVYLKGYEQNGKMLRYAQVVVTK